MQARALPWVRGGPQTASMRFDNRAADWQPHPCTMSLRGEEHAEDLFGLMGRQTHASIADRNEQLAFIDSPRMDGKFTCCVYVLHRVNAIEHKVHEDLLQLDAVCHYPGQILGEFSADGNRVSGGLVAQKDNHFSDKVVHIDQLGRRRTLLE